MRRLPRPFVALIAALLLVLAQQAALAHMIRHTGAAAQSALQQDEQQHDTAASLSHVCTTCIAFAALDGFVPSTSLPPLPVAEHHAPSVGIEAAHLGQTPPAHRARGPPQVL